MEQINLSIDKTNSADPSEMLVYDSIERGKTVDVTVNGTDGKPYDFSNLTVKFIGLKYNEHAIITEADVKSDDIGHFTYELPSQVYASSGRYKFEFYKDDAKIDTTTVFKIRINQDDDYVPDDSDYISDLEKIKKDYSDVLTTLNSSKESFNGEISNAKSQLDGLIAETKDQLKQLTEQTGKADQIQAELSKLEELSAKLSSVNLDELKNQIQTVSDNLSKIDLSDYVKKADLPSLDGYAKLDDLKPLAKKSDIPDTSNLVNSADLSVLLKTKADQTSFVQLVSEMKDKADKSDLPDVSNFATKSDIPNTDDLVKSADIEAELKTKADQSSVDELASEVKTKADKSDIPDVSNLASKSEIPDISNLAAKSEIPSIDGLAKTADVNKSIDDTKKALESEISVKANSSDLGKYLTTTEFSDRMKGMSTKVNTSRPISAVFTSQDDYRKFIDDPDTRSTIFTAFKYDTDQTNEDFSSGWETGVIFGQPRRNITISAAGTEHLLEVHIHSNVQPETNWSEQIAFKSDIAQMQSTIDALIKRVTDLESKLNK